jgi:hypothetical protein
MDKKILTPGTIESDLERYKIIARNFIENPGLFNHYSNKEYFSDVYFAYKRISQHSEENPRGLDASLDELDTLLTQAQNAMWLNAARKGKTKNDS